MAPLLARAANHLPADSWLLYAEMIAELYNPPFSHGTLAATG